MIAAAGKGQEFHTDVVNFKTTKHFRDKRNHYVDRSQWHITENVHEPIIDRSHLENVRRILENAPVKRPNGDGEIHPLSGLLFSVPVGAFDRCVFQNPLHIFKVGAVDNRLMHIFCDVP